MFQTETEISTTAVLPELVVLVYLFLNLLGFGFNLVKHKPLWNLKLRSALPLGRFNLFVYVSPAVQAFYPPTTTLLNFHIYLTCYVPDDTPVFWDCKSCSVNCFSLRKFEWQSYSCSATSRKRWTFCKTWDLTGISSWSFWTRFMLNFNDFCKCAIEPFVGLNIVFMTFLRRLHIWLQLFQIPDGFPSVAA